MPIDFSGMRAQANPLKDMEERLTALEDVIEVSHNKVVVTFGNSSITLAVDGSVTISGRDISIVSSGKVVMKSAGEISLKGAKINQN